MTNLMKVIHNTETGKIIEREITADELAQFETDQVKTAERKAVQAASDSAKAALLARLGITAEEATLLLS